MPRPRPPKWKKDWSDLAHIFAGLGGFGEAWIYIRRNFRVVKRYWVLFVVFVLLAGLGAFWLGRITAPASYPAPVPYTAARQTSEREWPPLTEAQIQEWVAALKPNPTAMIMVLFEPDVEAIEFFRSIKTVGKRLKWEIYHAGGSAENGASEIEVRSTLQFQPTGQVIAQLLNKMNYPAKFTSEAGNGGPVTITIPDKTK